MGYLSTTGSGQGLLGYQGDMTQATGFNATGTPTTWDYAYDGGGNRTRITESQGQSVISDLTTVYDAAGLPITASKTGESITYTHDKVGNLTKIDSTIAANDWASTYDAYSRLTCTKQATSCTSGTARVQLALDALDRTLTRTNAGATTTYTYQGAGELIAKAQGASTTTYAYTAGGAPLAEKTGATTLFALRDVHGDVVGRVSTAAGNASTVAYDPWGQVLSTTGPGQGLQGYQGDVTDPVTKQVDMGTRWYAPGLGRFSARDALFGDLGSPMSLNQHVYAGMNPVTMIDPTGMRTEAGDDPTQEGAESYSGYTQCQGSGGSDCSDAWANSPYTSDTGPSVDIPDPAPPLDVSAIVAMRGYTDVLGGCSRRCGAYADTTWSQELAQTQDSEDWTDNYSGDDNKEICITVSFGVPEGGMCRSRFGYEPVIGGGVGVGVFAADLHDHPEQNYVTAQGPTVCFIACFGYSKTDYYDWTKGEYIETDRGWGFQGWGLGAVLLGVNGDLF